MKKEMPKLEAGMMIVFDWKHFSEKRYLYLGGNATIDLDNTMDRSQPLQGDCGKIVAVYDVGKHLSIENLVDKDEFYAPVLIWEKCVKSQAEIKIEALEKTISDAQHQLQSIKRAI